LQLGSHIFNSLVNPVLVDNPMLAPHFLIENEIVWGATAMMLNELRMLMREML
jgi:hypothetical protein